ncbi:MAG TPA: hypothetical protein VF556_07755 [Pyrinomonadaceae bacterium]|jgi:uncharacterized protein YbcV (DUF1398 family)
MQIIEKQMGRNGDDKDERLKTIFERAKSGQMSFAEFKKAVEDFLTVF